MKVVKLNRRYKAFKFNFTHAIKFDSSFDPLAFTLERMLMNKYGVDWDYSREYKIFRGRQKYGNMPIYFAFKNEITITQCLLSIER